MGVLCRGGEQEEDDEAEFADAHLMLEGEKAKKKISLE